MAISMSTFLGVSLSLLLVLANAGSVGQQTRQSNLRQRGGRQPDGAEQEVLTREDIIQQNTPAVEVVPPASQPALYVPPQMQLSQMQQMQQLQQLQQLQQMQQMSQQPQQSMQAQQLLQAQAMQMQQMQQQLLQQQQELKHFEQLEKQREGTQQKVQQAKPKLQHKRQSKPRPARKVVAHRARPQRKALVGVKAQVGNAQAMTSQDKAKSELGSASGSAGVARPKGWDQCLKFARFVKGQDVTGVELVRVWKSTCEPAVQSGRATERYKLMCNSLSGVVEPYSSQLDYDVEQLCDSVLAVFHDVTAVDAKAR